VTTAEMIAEQPLLDRSLRRELARRLGGDAAAARVALDGDPVLARALAVLGAARGPRDVFAVASRPSAAPPRAASGHASGARR
jgi:hypothetical protein